MIKISKTIRGRKLYHKTNLYTDVMAYLIFKNDVPILKPSKILKPISKVIPDWFILSPDQILDGLIKDSNFLDNAYFRTEDIPVFLSYIPPKKDQPQKENVVTFNHENSKGESINVELPGNRVKFSKRLLPIEERIKNVIEEHESNFKKESHVFAKIGKVWFLKYDGDEWGLYPDNERYKYLSCLLHLTSNKSGKLQYSFYNTELVAKVKGKIFEMENNDEDNETKLDESDLDDKLTSGELNRIEDIGYDLLNKIQIAKEKNNNNSIKELKENFKNYQSHILNEYGLKSIVSKDGCSIKFSKFYRSSKEKEKIRQLIKNQINNAIRDLQDSMPTLSRHLKLSIKVKTNETSYLPEKMTQWYVAA